MWNNEREKIKSVSNPTAKAFGFGYLNMTKLSDDHRKKCEAHYEKLDKKAEERFTEKIKASIESGELPPNALETEKYVAPKRVESWVSCRDAFMSSQPNLTSYYFRHTLPVGRGRSIAVFFEKLEDKLNLPSDQRASFQATSRRDTVKVTPGAWWSAEPLRRSLFSALLRCADAYRINKDNFEQALYSTPYTASTKPAVQRFLAGCTHYKGTRNSGWLHAFHDGYGNSKTEINNLVEEKTKVKPKAKPKSSVPPAARAVTESPRLSETVSTPRRASKTTSAAAKVVSRVKKVVRKASKKSD